MNRTELAIVGIVLTGLLSVHCTSSDAGTPEEEGATSSAMGKTISSSYGVTTFGGPGDYQPLACGGHSRTVNKWYVASSQRYGCHVHLELTASNGKCVVVSTEDAGPATFVETRAGRPILDASPAVAEHLFGESGLGWSDVKAHPSKFSVTAKKTTAALGPCRAGAPTPTPTPTDDDLPPPEDPAPTPGGGKACASDGQCNPGNDGSGLICSGGVCVPGCHSNAQCPGTTTCNGGQCK